MVDQVDSGMPFPSGETGDNLKEAAARRVMDEIVLQLKSNWESGVAGFGGNSLAKHALDGKSADHFWDMDPCVFGSKIKGEGSSHEENQRRLAITLLFPDGVLSVSDIFNLTGGKQDYYAVAYAAIMNGEVNEAGERVGSFVIPIKTDGYKEGVGLWVRVKVDEYGVPIVNEVQAHLAEKVAKERIDGVLSSWRETTQSEDLEVEGLEKTTD